jgi:hypothetical protein
MRLMWSTVLMSFRVLTRSRPDRVLRDRRVAGLRAFRCAATRRTAVHVVTHA